MSCFVKRSDKVVVRHETLSGHCLAGRSPPIIQKGHAVQALLIGALVSTDRTKGFQLAATGAAPGPVEQQRSR